MTTQLRMAFEIFASVNRAMSATDIQVRMPMAIENPRRLTSDLRAMGKIAEAFRLRNERFFTVVPNAVPPLDGRADNSTAAAMLARRRQRLAMLARDARRRG